jgi:lysophospholipase
MAAKKSRSTKDRSAKEQQALARVRKLEAKLERSEDRARRWKKEAKRNRAELATLTTRAAKLDRKLTKARDAASRPAPAPAPEKPVPPTASPAAAATGSGRSSVAPDDSWTVAQLRAEARARGFTGLSNKPKAELLAALR